MGSTRKVSQVFNNNPQAKSTNRTTKKRRWNCVEIDVNKYKPKKLEREVKNTADLERFMKETKVHSGLQCHLRRKRRWRRRRTRMRRRRGGGEELGEEEEEKEKKKEQKKKKEGGGRRRRRRRRRRRGGGEE
jgi:hypothetical protein